MTRDEAKKKIDIQKSEVYPYGIIDNVDIIIDEIFDSLQNENKSLVKTLEKYNEEMIELRKCNQDLLNTIIEAQESIKNILECKK